jgi:SHS2 domain-containing protein
LPDKNAAFSSGAFFCPIMPYKFTDAHTSADIGLIATGETLSRMFIDAALGMTSIMTELEYLDDTVELSFELEADSIESLFYKWLSELIYYKDVERFFLKKGEIDWSNNNLRLSAVLSGDRINAEKHVLKVDIKAVTLYKLRVEKIGDIWHGEVIFDL